MVVLIVPMTDATRGMVDTGFLARMTDGALLVNVARGGRWSTPTHWWRRSGPAGSTPPSTSPTPNRCPRTTRCGTARTC